MTPDELNTLVAKLVDALSVSPAIDDAQATVPADAAGAVPEIYVELGGVDLVLTVSPL